MAAPQARRQAGDVVRTPQRLLDLDPELGRLLPADRIEEARRSLLVRSMAFPTGRWDASRLEHTDPAHLGLLLVQGVLAREVVIGDTVATELLGPGDLVRPWQVEESPALLKVSVRWNALSPLRVAILD